MIKFLNYCKPDSVKLLGVKGAFDDETDGELLPCPICGRMPRPMVRKDWNGNFAAISCFGGGTTTHAYVSVAKDKPYLDCLNDAVALWNAGEIDYYERLPNVFRSCYTCANYKRERGAAAGICEKGLSANIMAGCEKEYVRMSHEAFHASLTR